MRHQARIRPSGSPPPSRSPSAIRRARDDPVASVDVNLLIVTAVNEEREAVLRGLDADRHEVH
ncbi:MAG: hypothetical protein ACRDXX_06605, partial [Stackebrandtia sp.]